MRRPAALLARPVDVRRAVAAALAAPVLVPSSAQAHGLVQRSDLPVPEWLFGWAAAVVLVVSFVALAVLWPSARLERTGWRPLPGGRQLGSRPVEALCGAAGVGLLAAVLWSGLAGVDGPQDNLAPTFILVVFWVGLVPVSVLLGDVFRALNPWRALGRVLFGGRSLRPYPERLGRWPAAAGLLGFTWIELASGWSAEPRSLAIAAIAYTVFTLAAMATYGVEAWTRDGEAFSVYFGLFARLSVFETRDRVVGVRPLLGGLPGLQRLPGTVAVLAVMIGTVTFDGLSQGRLWLDGVGRWLNDGLTSAGLGAEAAATLASTVGLLLGVGLVAGFYHLGIAGARSVGGGFTTSGLRLGFVHSLVPIALVYVMAHYLTLLVFQGQAVGYLASDPLGRGWDLFGTASAAIDYSVLGQTTAWYLQVGFVVAGHVAALVLAHDRALAVYGQAREAVRSQYWMLGIMVGFTTLALWLLAQASA